MLKSFLLLLIINNILLAEGIFINTVISFNPGSGQNIGQSKDYFPQNIFGPPSRIASESVPESSPDNILSIGLGGEIIVANNQYIIKDGIGPDFTIFENAFINPINGKVFAEPATVSVSQDGIKWYDFPYEYSSLKGCAGMTPTNGSEDFNNPTISGGDQFDLSDIGLSYIRYIKIKDITEIILEDKNHYYYDPILSGFDLDAIVYLNYEYQEILSVEVEKYYDYFNISNNYIEFLKVPDIAILNNLEGKEIAKITYPKQIRKGKISSKIVFITLVYGRKEKYFKILIN